MKYNTDMTNADRAERAKRALLEYVNSEEDRWVDITLGNAEVTVEAASDMLCDLFHLVNAVAPDKVQNVLNSGWRTHLDEVTDERMAAKE